MMPADLRSSRDPAKGHPIGQDQQSEAEDDLPRV